MPALRKLAASIRTTPAKKRDFKKEAASLNLSYVHFRTLFREATGFPPKQFLLKCRVSTARHLLKNSRDSLEEIAETVGIDNVYYFSRLFKKHFHIPPGRYRKEFL
jgi:AraC family transcriptional activator of mtrCDE